MLTSDLVRARASDGKLVLSKWRGDARKDARHIAEQYLETIEGMVGEPRESILEAFRGVEVRLRLEKVAEGLKKLILDEAEFEADGTIDPVALREEVFLRSTEARKAAATSEDFDRLAVLREVAAKHETGVEEIERLLFSDLRGAHRLLRAPTLDANELLDLYDEQQEQAVLLKAERVVVEVECRSPGAYRALFRRLKFLRLLPTIDPLPKGGYRLTIEGPYALFASTTKYGLALAMLVPALRECDRYALVATVRWGKNRQRLVFESEGRIAPLARPATDLELASLPEEVVTLAEAFREKHGDEWAVEPSKELLEVRGLGISVPDLVFTHRATGSVVYFESLGFWSREAVWKRVELVRKGLPQPILFAVPARLRVSEEVLPDDLPGALYVYKGTLRIGAVLERLNKLAGLT